MKKKMKSIAFSLAIIAAGTLSMFIYSDAKSQGEGHPNCQYYVSSQCIGDPWYSCYAQVDFGVYAWCPQKRNY